MLDLKEERLEFFDGESESLAAIPLQSRALMEAGYEHPPSSILRFVWLKAGGTIVGQVNFHAINSKMQNAEI